MTRDEMIVYMHNNPNVKITHRLFDSDEYIYQKEDGRVYDENGYLFEDWKSDYRDGIRMRNDGAWLTGWSIYNKLDPLIPINIDDTKNDNTICYEMMGSSLRDFMQTISERTRDI